MYLINHIAIGLVNCLIKCQNAPKMQSVFRLGRKF